MRGYTPNYLANLNELRYFLVAMKFNIRRTKSAVADRQWGGKRHTMYNAVR